MIILTIELHHWDLVQLFTPERTMGTDPFFLTHLISLSIFFCSHYLWFIHSSSHSDRCLYLLKYLYCIILVISISAYVDDCSLNMTKIVLVFFYFNSILLPPHIQCQYTNKYLQHSKVRFADANEMLLVQRMLYLYILMVLKK